MPGSPPLRTVEQMRLREHLITPQPGEHAVTDRAVLAAEFEHAPQRTRVVLGLTRAVPLVHAAIAPATVVGEPELGAEAGEPDEERRVEDALRSEPRVASAADASEPETDDEDARIARHTGDHGLPIHASARPVREPHHPVDLLARPVQLPPREHHRAADHAAGDCAPRGASSQRRSVMRSPTRRSIGFVGVHVGRLPSKGGRSDARVPAVACNQGGPVGRPVWHRRRPAVPGP